MDPPNSRPYPFADTNKPASLSVKLLFINYTLVTNWSFQYGSMSHPHLGQAP